MQWTHPGWLRRAHFFCADWSDGAVDRRSKARAATPLGDTDAVKLAGLKVATYTDNGAMTPNEDVAQVVNTAADAVAAAGATVTTALPEAISDAIAIIPRLREAEGGSPIRRALERAGTTNPSSSLAYALNLPPPPPGDVLSHALEDLGHIRRRMLGFLQHYDAIVCPVAPWTARVHGFDSGENRYNAWSHCMAYNVTGWPGVSVRAGTSADGLPIGVAGCRQTLARGRCAGISTRN